MKLYREICLMFTYFHGILFTGILLYTNIKAWKTGANIIYWNNYGEMYWEAGLFILVLLSALIYGIGGIWDTNKSV